MKAQLRISDAGAPFIHLDAGDTEGFGVTVLDFLNGKTLKLEKNGTGHTYNIVPELKQPEKPKEATKPKVSWPREVRLRVGIKSAAALSRELGVDYSIVWQAEQMSKFKLSNAQISNPEWKRYSEWFHSSVKKIKEMEAIALQKVL